MRKLGQRSDLAIELSSGNDEKREEFAKTWTEEREKRMAEGKGDRWEGMQQSVMPTIDSKLKGFRVEMLFEYPNEVGGGTYLDWAHGVVTNVISTKTTKKFEVK